MTTPRPFRFGFHAGGTVVRSPETWRDLAQKAEALGYATFTVGDHVVNQHAPLLLLQYLAGWTKTLRLGTAVLDNDFRHPAILSKELATLDLLSGGRLEIGIGAGWIQEDYDKSGIAYDPPPVRLARMMETVQIIKALGTGEPLTFEGKHYRITGLTLRPQQLQRPHPPILIGGSGPRLLAFAAREANGVGFLSTLKRADPQEWTLEGVATKTARVRALAADRDVELQIWPDLVAIAEDRAATIAGTAKELGVRAEDLERSAYVLVGPPARVIEDIVRLRERTGISYITIRDRIEEFAPVVAKLAGT